jgi:uncharacterized membrane protein YbaN (DUF454 family)
LAAIGIVLPILPTTPFLLLAAACYLKGSTRMHNWLLRNKIFGAYIRNYKEGKGMTLRAKAFTLILLWVTIAFSAIFMVSIFAIQLFLLGVCIAVTLHLVRLPTYREKLVAQPQEPLQIDRPEN